ncbi:helix-turn-helix domain-containing protein [Eggerthella timonensis]|uniref:helix-turn-helix domain-containing protein n=1 Tax=Eggerthella timonensis TaxID=1871008 RepID=UPI000C761518|nr:helix-turn-helix transcriptional regulator [Eggerthella timonensis]
MGVVIRLDRVLADRKMTLCELSERVGISTVSLSRMKTGKVQGFKLSTLARICDVLDCQPGDLLEYVRD